MSRRNTVWLVSSLVIVGGVCAAFLVYKQFISSDLDYRQVDISRHPLTVTIQTTGTVEPMNKVEILPPIAGRIESIEISEGDQVKKGHVIAWMSSTNRAALLDLAQTRSAQEFKKWEGMYEPTPITAPVDGLIIKKKVVPGQTIGQQTVLFDMSDTLIVRAQVDETDIGKIKIDMEAAVTVDALPNQSFRARVSLISHQSELINNVNIYAVELLPIDLPPACRSGMTANIDFILSHTDSALTLPLWAVQGAENVEVRVLDANKQAKSVKLGKSNGKFVEVISGAQEGETVYVPSTIIELKEVESSPFSPFGRRKKSQGQ